MFELNKFISENVTKRQYSMFLEDIDRNREKLTKALLNPCSTINSVRFLPLAHPEEVIKYSAQSLNSGRMGAERREVLNFHPLAPYKRSLFCRPSPCL